MVVLEARQSDLEAWLCAAEKPIASQCPLGSAVPSRVAPTLVSSSPAVPMQLGPQASYEMVQSRHGAYAKAKTQVHHRPVHNSNQFSSLSDTPN